MTPVNVDKLEQLLDEVDYNHDEKLFLCNGFRHGFDLSYRGPEARQDTSSNLPLTVGSPVVLWNKIMDEVKVGRYAGPFDAIPYKTTYNHQSD